MMWIIQKNLLNDDAYWRITIALDELGIPWKPIDIIPFSDELNVPAGITNPCIFYGSTSLQRLVAARPELKPGVWAGPNFNYELHIEKYKGQMVNSDAKIYPFTKVPQFDGVKFIRPVYDTKSFTGALVGGDEFQTWQNNVLGVAGWLSNPEMDSIRSSIMTPDTLTMVCEPKNILLEFRFFVVGGKAITGSLYHESDRLKKRNIDYNSALVDDKYHPIDKMVWEYVQRQVDVWQPADGFVMDVGVLEDDRGLFYCKIVELNSFNCSGIYDCDERLIIQAVEQLS